MAPKRTSAPEAVAMPDAEPTKKLSWSSRSVTCGETTMVTTMKRWRASSGSAGLLLLAAILAARVGILLASPVGLSGDQEAYVAASRHIAATGELPPLRIQPHGLPLLIAPLSAIAPDSVPRLVLWMNVLADTAVVLFLAVLAWRLLASCGRLVRLSACAVCLIQPFTATMASTVLTEQIAQFFLFFGIVSLTRAVPSRSVWLLVGTALFGLAGILRLDLLVMNFGLLITILALHAWRASAWGATLRRATIATCVYAAFPLLMLGYQFASTGELGLTRSEQANQGYLQWMRTWLAWTKEHDRLGFGRGKPSWSAWEVDNFPSRAFDSPEEEAAIAALLGDWQANGYSTEIDDEFRDLARERVRRNPLRHYVGIPTARMLHFWINVDGAQTFLRVVELPRPWSTLIVAFCLLLRLGFLALAALASSSAWKPPKPDRSGFVVVLFQACLLAVVMRTLELGTLGPFMGAGLIETRYVVVAFPPLIVLSLAGLQDASGLVERFSTRLRRKSGARPGSLPKAVPAS